MQSFVVGTKASALQHIIDSLTARIIAEFLGSKNNNNNTLRAQQEMGGIDTRTRIASVKVEEDIK